MTDVLGQTDPSQPAEQEIPTGIVVGVDGSACASHALRWAVAQSPRFGPVTPVVAWHYPWWVVPTVLPGGPPIPAGAEFEATARSQVGLAVEEVAPTLSPSLIVHLGRPGPTLVELGASANLIVVGTRGRGAMADAVLGSTSSHVVRHATVPVVVVPEQASVEEPWRRVVVGVDGSPHSVAALTWALRNAPAGARLEVIHAWSYHLASYPEVVTLSVEVFEEEAQACLDRTLEAARAASTAGPLPPMEAQLVYGDPRHVLAAAADGADLLVVGARGHEGVAHLLVGSVTTSLVHDPRLATVVVPAR